MKKKIVWSIATAMLASMLSGYAYPYHKSEAGTQIAVVQDSVIQADHCKADTETDFRSYTASVSDISYFWDAEGNYQLVYNTEDQVLIQVMDTDMKLLRTVTIPKQYPLYGECVVDDAGQYYLVLGQNDEKSVGNIPVIFVGKYDRNGSPLGSAEYTGNETRPYEEFEWGTRYPFDAGNCDVKIVNGTLVCSYAREMYSGHQSNHVIYVDCATMTKLPYTSSYTSHSFDQRVIGTQDGGFLFADLGDAYGRGFNVSYISKLMTSTFDTLEKVPFHFREGANRDYGYNETYAQLGGIEESQAGYLLTGTSEGTLSLDTAPTGGGYCGYSEARNLFVQALKKDYYNYSGEAQMAAGGSVRTVTGNRPSGALTQLFLKGDEVDYGVQWLTQYTLPYTVMNPQFVKIDEDRFLVFYEVYRYSKKNQNDPQFQSSYYAAIAGDGRVIQPPIPIPGRKLTANQPPVYHNGTVNWITSLDKPDKLIAHTLTVGQTESYQSMARFRAAGDKKGKIYTGTVEKTTAALTFLDGQKELIPGLDYTIGTPKVSYSAGKQKVTVTLKGNASYQGTYTYSYLLRPSSVKIQSLKSSGRKLKITLNQNESADGYEFYYSTDRNFKKNVHKLSNWNPIISFDTGKSKTKYYVKARSYVNVKNHKVYSEFSPVKSAKTK